MANEWTVRVRDDAGNPITNAKVSMLRETNVPKTAVVFSTVIELPLKITHTHTRNGQYTSIAPAPVDPTGDWRLIVNADGKSIVIQPFKITTGSGGLFKTVPRNLEHPSKIGLEAQVVDIKTVVAGTSS